MLDVLADLPLTAPPLRSGRKPDHWLIPSAFGVRYILPECDKLSILAGMDGLGDGERPCGSEVDNEGTDKVRP